MRKIYGLCVGLAVLAFGLLSAGCSAKEAVPAESTAVETEAETKDPFSLGGVDVKVETNAPKVDIISSEDGAYVGTTPAGETQYAFDKYGPLGKEVWEAIALQWTTHALDTESDLRATMDATYGQLSTKEELTQDILALTRDPQPQQESLAANQGNGTPTESTKAANTETKSQPAQPAQPATQPTKPATQPTKAQPTAPQPTENHTAESQSPSNETQTPQTQQQNTSNNGLIPGTNLPSTGDPALDAYIRENNANGEQGGLGTYPDSYTDQGKGLNWN